MICLYNRTIKIIMEFIFDVHKELDDVIELLKCNYTENDNRNSNINSLDNQHSNTHNCSHSMNSSNQGTFDIHNYTENKDTYVNPTPFTISTISALAFICSDIDLDFLSKYMKINKHIRYLEYGKDMKRGTPTKKISKKKELKKKIFFNQITLVVNISAQRFIKTKIFTNGKVEMVGLKYIDEGKKVLELLIEEIRNTKENIEGNLCNAAKEPNNMKVQDYWTYLINTDFKTNFKIKRDALHKLLIQEYNMFSKYEPCIYPGVDTKFYWNKQHKHNGVCSCTEKCNGKGYGDGNGDCKKITIAAFQSGSVIITGARTMEQVQDAYTFINSVFKKHFHSIHKILPSFIKEIDEKCKAQKSRKYYYLNKSLIKNRYLNVQSNENN